MKYNGKRMPVWIRPAWDFKYIPEMIRKPDITPDDGFCVYIAQYKWVRKLCYNGGTK